MYPGRLFNNSEYSTGGEGVLKRRRAFIRGFFFWGEGVLKRRRAFIRGFLGSVQFQTYFAHKTWKKQLFKNKILCRLSEIRFKKYPVKFPEKEK